MNMAATPDSIEPIIGWRYWTVLTDAERQPRLASLMAHNLRWTTDQPFVAHCLNPDPQHVQHHPAATPNADCTCGIYAMASFEQLRQRMVAVDELCTMVVGRVKLWGRVIPGEYGYRAQLAYPEELWVIEGLGSTVKFRDELMETLAHAYNVPVSSIPLTDSGLDTLSKEDTGPYLSILIGNFSALEIPSPWRCWETWIALASLASAVLDAVVGAGYGVPIGLFGAAMWGYNSNTRCGWWSGLRFRFAQWRLRRLGQDQLATALGTLRRVVR